MFRDVVFALFSRWGEAGKRTGVGFASPGARARRGREVALVFCMWMRMRMRMGAPVCVVDWVCGFVGGQTNVWALCSRLCLVREAVAGGGGGVATDETGVCMGRVRAFVLLCDLRLAGGRERYGAGRE